MAHKKNIKEEESGWGGGGGGGGGDVEYLLQVLPNSLNVEWFLYN